MGGYFTQKPCRQQGGLAKKWNPELKFTQDIDKHADYNVTAIRTAVDKAILTSKTGRPESRPVSDETTCAY